MDARDWTREEEGHEQRGPGVLGAGSVIMYIMPLSNTLVQMPGLHNEINKL